jgi:chromosome segregation ATPase
VSDEVDALRAEVMQLRADLEIARSAAKAAEHDAGEARAALVELKVQLGRARQEQEAAMAGRRRWRRG